MKLILEFQLDANKVISSLLLALGRDYTQMLYVEASYTGTFARGSG